MRSRLRNAHGRLDAAVYAAYGWSVDLPAEEVLKRLFALTLERDRVAEAR